MIRMVNIVKRSLLATAFAFASGGLLAMTEQRELHMTLSVSQDARRREIVLRDAKKMAIGSLSYRFSPELNEVYVNKLYVRSDCRRAGLSKILIVSMIADIVARFPSFGSLLWQALPFGADVMSHRQLNQVYKNMGAVEKHKLVSNFLRVGVPTWGLCMGIICLYFGDIGWTFMYTILAASLFDKAATPFKFDLTRLSADKSLLDLRKISDYYVRGGARFTREIPMDPAPKNAQYETLSDLGLSSIADFYPF